MLLMMVDGDMDLLLLVRVKKKERQEEPSSSNREGKKEWNVNQIIQTIYQHGKNQILLLLL